MINIYINNIKVFSKEKQSHTKVFLCLENGEKIKYGDVKRVEIECDECNKRNEINVRSDLFKRDEYLCFSCLHKGERNHFKGKHHTRETKERMSKLKKGKPSPHKGKKHTGKALENMRAGFKKRDQNGSKNPFYGKHHTNETKKRIVDKRRKTMSKWSTEQKEEHSKKLSNGQKRLMEKDIHTYKKHRTNACRKSHQSQGRYKKNKIEKIVEQKLNEYGLKTFDYSVILGYNQYDFGDKNHKILLEVNGDYWHCNPEIYKHPITDTQKMKICRDVEKQKFALEHGYKYFVIWEKQIRNNDFSILKQIKNEIQIQNSKKMQIA